MLLCRLQCLCRCQLLPSASAHSCRYYHPLRVFPGHERRQCDWSPTAFAHSHHITLSLSPLQKSSGARGWCRPRRSGPYQLHRLYRFANLWPFIEGLCRAGSEGHSLPPPPRQLPVTLGPTVVVAVKVWGTVTVMEVLMVAVAMVMVVVVVVAVMEGVPVTVMDVIVPSHRHRSPRLIHRHLAPTPPPPPLLPPRRQGPCTTFTCTSRRGATSCGPPPSPRRAPCKRPWRRRRRWAGSVQQV